jgi:hypothetical protein
VAEVHVKIGQRVVGIYPVEAISQMRADGLDASAATAEEAEDYEIRKESGTAMGQLEALGSAAASGVTLGLSDLAVSDPRRTKMLRQMVPGTGLAEFTGAALPVLLTGGTGAAGKGMLAGLSRLTPTALAARTGTAAGRAVGGLVGSGAKRLSGKVIQAAAPLAAAAATETALYSGGAEISESALGGVEQSAERIAAAMGHGALLGGVLGAGLGVPLGVGKHIKDRVVSRAQSLEMDKVVAAAAATVPEEGLGKAVADKMNKASSTLSTVDQQLIDEYGPFARGDTAEEFHRLVLERGKTADEFAEATYDAIKGIQKGDPVFENIYRTATGKPEYVRSIIEPEMVKTAQRASRQLITENEGRAAVILSESQRFATPEVKRAAAKFVRDIQTKAKRAFRGKQGKYRTIDHGEGYVAADAMKADAHNLAKKYLRSTHQDPLVKSEYIELGGWLQKFGDRNLAALEDAAQFGAMGTRQAKNNKPFPNFITAKDNLRGVMAKFQQVGLGERPKMLPDLAKLKSKIGQMDDVKRSDLLATMEEFVDSGDQVLRSIAEGKVLTAEESAVMKTVKNAVETYRPVLAKFKKSANAGKIFDQIVESQRMGLGSVMGQSATLVGGIAGGVPGALLGMGASLIMNPAQGIMMRASVQRAMDLAAIKLTTTQVGQQLRTSAKALVRSGRTAAERVKRGARAVGRGVAVGARVARREAERQVGKSDAQRRAQFERRRKQIQRMAENPQFLAAQVANSTEAFAEAAPITAKRVGEVTQRGVRFLMGKLPAMYSIDPVYRGKVSASPSEISKWNRYYDAIQSPMKVLGKPDELLPDHIEAIEATTPTLLDEYRRNVVEEFARSGDKMPYGMRVRIGALLHLPLDPSLSTRPASEVGAPEEEPAPAPAPRGPTTQLAASQVRAAQKAGGSLSTGTEAVRTSRHPRMT